MPGETARSDPRPSVRVTRGAVSGQHLASVLQEGRGNANIDAGLVHLENLGSGGFRSQTSEFEAFHRERRIMPKERFGRGRTGVGGRYCIINSGAVFVMTNRQAEKCQTLITRT